MKTIGINALFLIPNQVGGTEYHLRTTLRGLQATQSGVHFVLFCNEENFDTFDIDQPNWSKVRCNVRATNRVARLLFEQFFLPFLLIKYHCESVHSFGYCGPILTPRVRQIITVHDANWRDVPEDVSFFQRMVLRVCIELNLLTATTIITDSTFSLSRLQYYFPYFRKKIVVILPVVSLQFPAKKLKRHTHTLLCVSGMYPHKRVSYVLQLIRVLHTMDARWRAIIIGKNGAEEHQLMQRIKTMSYVQHFPKVNREILTHWYQTASVFVFPSVYEGFGYPVYEAAAAGMQIFVGRKKFYHNALHPSIFKFSSNGPKDAEAIARVVKTSMTAQHHLPSFDLTQASQKLISIYVQH